MRAETVAGKGCGEWDVVEMKVAKSEQILVERKQVVGARPFQRRKATRLDSLVAATKLLGGVVMPLRC